jgi:hypothetical protein
VKLVGGDWGGMGYRVDFADSLIPYKADLHSYIYIETYIDVQQNTSIYITFTYIPVG